MHLRLLLPVFFFLFPVFVVAQSGKGTVSGVVTDSAGRQPVVYASVTVFNAADTSIVTYRLSDEKGEFKVPGLPLDTPLRVLVQAMGYQVFRHDFTLTGEIPALGLPTVKLLVKPTELEEVVITAERPPVVVGKDTIEFNADAFKTLPTAMLEDLLKKFPGLNVDDGGNITVNGRPVNKILVEGKEFFGNNQKMATRNLPASLISRVQVTDDKEQLARNPDISPGDLGQVINLKLKRSVKQGVVGKFTGGAGTNDRYTLQGNINTFRDKLHVSVLGNSNNLNRNSGGGIGTSSGGGANLNAPLSKGTSLSVQYNYSKNTNLTDQKNVNNQFLKDTTITSQSSSHRENDNFSHRVSAYLKSKIDSTGTFEYRPSFTFSGSTHASRSNSLSFRTVAAEAQTQPLNSGDNSSHSTGGSFVMSHEVSLQKSFRRRGRSVYATANVNVNNSDNDRYSHVVNEFFRTHTTTVLDQLRNQDQRNTSAKLYVNYNEPLSPRFSIRLTQSLDWTKQSDYIYTYDQDAAQENYTDLVEELTSGLSRGGFRSNTGLGLRYRKDKFQVIPGVTLQALNLQNRFRSFAGIDQKFFYVLPVFQIRYDRLTFNYRVNASEPQVSDLQPVTNNSNPLYITLGNPDLKPSVAHVMDVNMDRYDVKRQLNYSVTMSGSVRNNGVVRARTVDGNGVQVTRPVNVNGIWNANFSGRVRKEHRLSEKLKFTTGLQASSGYRQGMLMVNDNRTVSTSWNAGGRVSLYLNWDDKLELEQSYAPDFSEISYSTRDYQGVNVWKHSSGTGLTVRLPRHWVWDSQINYRYNPQVAANMRKSAVLWNAGVGYLFLKNDAAQVRLSVYDLLNQNNSVSRSVSENFIRDTEVNILRRYYMVSFSYNLRKFSGKGGGRGRNAGGSGKGSRVLF